MSANLVRTLPLCRSARPHFTPGRVYLIIVLLRSRLIAYLMHGVQEKSQLQCVVLCTRSATCSLGIGLRLRLWLGFAVCLKSEIHEMQSLARNPLPNQRNPPPKKRNPRNPPSTTKSTFVQPETKMRNPRNPVTGTKSTIFCTIN